MTDREQQGTDDGRLTRRRFVVAASGAVAAAGLHGVPALAKPASRGEREPFAVVADSHLDPFSPDHSDNMRAVFDHILARSERPAFVEHVGDVVEIGFPEEYAEWRRVRPDALVDLIRAVPGNHEVRWDEFAKELYFAEFEQTPYSFDAAGVHVVALDPTQLLQEPGFFSRAQLEWLREDLKRAGQDVPSVVFVHYPMSGDYLYVGNQEEFLRAVEGFDVRAVVAGHIHRQEVMRVNGITSVTLPGILNTAAYHWVTPVTGADGADALAITLAQRGAAGWQETPVVEIPVEGERRALRRAPKLRTEVAGDRSSVEVVADLHPAQDADAARARFVPESVFGGRSSAGWTALAPEQGGRRWRGTVDASALAAGLHELQVQASDGDARFEATEAVELPATATDRLRLAWEKDLVTAIQAGLAPLPDDRLVAATVGGAVVALDAGGSQPSERWRREAAGPVYGTPATDPEGRRVFVPTATGVVHAFDAADGREAW
ncbi:MAG: metallophosphoesterase, partial [Solirubrobacteraceae bacterium]